MRATILFLGSALVMLTVGTLPAAEVGANGKYILTYEQIRALNVRTINDLMNQIPGVSAGTSSVSILGSTAVRVFLDGRPINDPLSSRGTVKWELVSLNEVERIEIFTGGETALFGDDSSGGVIKIMTRKLDGERGNLELGTGRFHAGNFELGYQTTLGGWGAGFSLSDDRTDGFRENNDAESRTAGLKASVPLDSGNSLSLSADHAREERGSPGLPEFPTPNSRAHNRTTGMNASLATERITSTTYFNQFEKRNTDPDIALDSVLESWSVGEDLKSDLVFPALGPLKAGANLETSEVSGNRMQSHREDRLGLVGAKSFTPRATRTLVTLGLRWNYYSEFDETINPELKLDHRIGKLSLHAGAARTNNIPTYLQRYTESSTTVPNPDLRMEGVVTCKAGATYQTGDILQAGMSLFDSRITDSITYIRGDNGIGSYQNIGQVTQRGAEFTLKWKPAPAWDIRPSHLYLETLDDATGYTLPFRPRRQTRLDIQWQITPVWSASTNTQLTSEQYSRPNHLEEVAGYTVTNFQTDYIRGNDRFLLRIENLFDHDYKYGDGYPAPPRVWRATWSREF